MVENTKIKGRNYLTSHIQMSLMEHAFFPYKKIALYMPL